MNEPIPCSPSAAPPAGAAPTADFCENPTWRWTASLIWLALVVIAVVLLGTVGYVLLANKLYSDFLEAALSDYLTNLLVPALMIPAMVVIMRAGTIDFSVGAVMNFTGILLAVLLNSGMPLMGAVVAALASGVTIGAINGFLVGTARIHGVLATLAVAVLIGGIGRIVSSEQAVILEEKNVSALDFGRSFGWVALILAVVIGEWLVQCTRFGQRPATDVAESRLARSGFVGLPFVLSGLLAGIAGLVQLGRLQATSVQFPLSTNIEVMWAVVLGGTCINGRWGSVSGAILGIAIITALRQVLMIIGAPVALCDLVTGALFLLTLVACHAYQALIGWLYRRRLQGRSAVR
jgi:ribose transport system permease protein